MTLEALIYLGLTRSCRIISEQDETDNGRISNRPVAGSIPAGCATNVANTAKGF
jgi:hypothetical protein